MTPAPGEVRRHGRREDKNATGHVIGLHGYRKGLPLPSSRSLLFSSFVDNHTPTVPQSHPCRSVVRKDEHTSSLCVCVSLIPFFPLFFYHKFLGNFPISKEIFGRISEDWMCSCFTPNAFNMRIRPVVSNKNILPELVPGGFIKIAVDKQS